MSTKLPQNQIDQEIDLVQISKKINNFFNRINVSIFKGMYFFLKNWIIVLILVIAGFSLGTFLDKTQKIYEQQIIVVPNFGSVDYLYAKIDLMQSKILADDQSFFTKFGISKNTKILKIAIEPIVDVFKFVDNNENNLELLRLMTSNGDFKSIIKENTTSKIFPFYIITISTKGFLQDENVLNSLLNNINSSQYYSDVQKISFESIKKKIKANEEIILQIDNVLNKYSNTEVLTSLKNDKMVYYNENVQLNDIIKTKESLIIENETLKIELVTSDKIIKELSVVTNIEQTKTVNGKMKFVLPFSFLLFFIFFLRVRKFYNKQKALQV